MNRPSVTGVILAGGQSRRMGQQDKASLKLHGKPMIQHVIECLAPQTDELIICTGSSQNIYTEYSYRQIADTIGDQAGPLAGIYSALLACTTDQLVVVPCDAPFIPADLVTLMQDTLSKANAQACICQNSRQSHPLPCLIERQLTEKLREYLDLGQRKVATWLNQQNTARLLLADESGVFVNINTADDLLLAEQYER